MGVLVAEWLKHVPFTCANGVRLLKIISQTHVNRFSPPRVTVIIRDGLLELSSINKFQKSDQWCIFCNKHPTNSSWFYCFDFWHLTSKCSLYFLCVFLMLCTQVNIMRFLMLLWVYVHTRQVEKLAWPRCESNPRPLGY
jgi:hypothetical protein